MVGFNGRFAPQVVRAKEMLAPIDEPKCMVVTVNAGGIPSQHWTQDPAIGGGRLIGEGATSSTCCGSLRAPPLLTST